MQSAPAEALSVLVVDDDLALSRTLCDILRLHGYAATTAATGREGLEEAGRRLPALAVVDLRLPDMDGMEVVARLHALSELTEVVVLTGNASLESAVAAMRENSIDYLLKPVQVERLLNVASVATERWQRRRAEEKLRESDERYRHGLEVRARQSAAVADFGQRALLTFEVRDLLDEAVRLVAATLELPFATVLERKSDGSALILRAGVGWNPDEIGHMLVPISDDKQAGYTFSHDEPTIVSNFAAEQRFNATQLAMDHGIVSGATVVIPGGIRPFGVLGAHDVREREFTEDHLHFLQAIAHIVGTAIERHRSEAASRQAQRLEAVGQLASGVAHDFNNMLTAITAYAEMLREGLAGDERARDVDEILGAAARAAGLTRQLLAFSRQQMLQPRTVKLNDIVAGIEKMLQPLIGANIALTMSLSADLGFVKADPGQIEQVLLNLCVNSRDAMPDGGTITIETSNAVLDSAQSRELSLEAPGSYVMLGVTDTGIGMDAETRARIFEPFFTTKAADQGTGLGLSTVYGITKQSGGEIWVYSEPSRGTTFKIFLPRVEREVRSTPTRIAAIATERGSETVLLAEDEDTIRRIAVRILERAGYKVLAAKNGAEALVLSRGHPGAIDLLVSDMMMPNMLGSELAASLRGERPDMRVLFLSGYTDVTMAARGLLADDVAFLQKPFATETLTRKIRETLDA